MLSFLLALEVPTSSSFHLWITSYTSRIYNNFFVHHHYYYLLSKIPLDYSQKWEICTLRCDLWRTLAAPPCIINRTGLTWRSQSELNLRAFDREPLDYCLVVDHIRTNTSSQRFVVCSALRYSFLNKTGRRAVSSVVIKSAFSERYYFNLQ